MTTTTPAPATATGIRFAYSHFGTLLRIRDGQSADVAYEYFDVKDDDAARVVHNGVTFRLMGIIAFADGVIEIRAMRQTKRGTDYLRNGEHRLTLADLPFALAVDIRSGVERILSDRAPFPGDTNTPEPQPEPQPSGETRGTIYPRIPGTFRKDANAVRTGDVVLWNGQGHNVRRAGHDLESSNGIVFTRTRIDFFDGTHISVPHGRPMTIVPRESYDRFRRVLKHLEPEQIQRLADSAKVFAMAEYHMSDDGEGGLLATTPETVRVESLVDDISTVRGYSCVVATVSYALPRPWKCTLALAADDVRAEVNESLPLSRFTPWKVWLD